MLKAIVIASTLATTLSGCSLFKSKGMGEAVEAKDPTLPEHVIVVQRPGAPKAILSAYDQDQWLELRKDAKQDHLRMLAALAAGEQKVAIQEAHQYLRKHPKDRIALTVLANGYVLDQNVTRAGFYADLLERFHPGTSVAKNVKGIATMLADRNRIKDYRLATQYFEEAFRSSGREVASGLNLGNLYLELGDAAKAKDVFEIVRGRCENCIEALLGSGISKSRLNEYAEAKLDFEQVLDKEDNHNEALYRLALVAQNGENDVEKAKSYLNQLIEHADSDGNVMRQARTMLTRLETMRGRQERLEIARENAKRDASEASSGSDATDADALLTDMEKEDQ